MLVWQVGFRTCVWRVGAMFADLSFSGIRRSLQGEMRDCGRDVAEERFVFVGFNPVAGFPGDAFGGVLIADKAIVGFGFCRVVGRFQLLIRAEIRVV